MRFLNCFKVAYPNITANMSVSFEKIDYEEIATVSSTMGNNVVEPCWPSRGQRKASKLSTVGKDVQRRTAILCVFDMSKRMGRKSYNHFFSKRTF